MTIRPFAWWSLPPAATAKQLVAGLTLLVASCDGSFTGGGIGGTGAPVAPALVVGVVDGFGSVIINDRRYVTNDADLLIDSNPVLLRDLRIGMTLSAKVDANSMSAYELRYQPDFVGPVSNIDADNGVLEIHGQTARWNEVTVFDDMDQSEMTLGLALEVSGTRNANREIVATYIRKAVPEQPYYVVGRVVPATDGVGLMIGEAVLDYKGAADSLGIPHSAFKTQFLSIGTIVRVAVDRISVERSGGSVERAESGDNDDTVTLAISGAHSINKPAYDAGDSVQIRGVVSLTDSQQRFLVSDIQVLIEDVTRTVTAPGMPIDFPDVPENRPVLIDGVALSGNGEVLVHVIQFLDQH